MYFSCGRPRDSSASSSSFFSSVFFFLFSFEWNYSKVSVDCELIAGQFPSPNVFILLLFLKYIFLFQRSWNIFSIFRFDVIRFNLIGWC